MVNVIAFVGIINTLISTSLPKKDMLLAMNYPSTGAHTVLRIAALINATRPEEQ
jgi:hypothetical protein